MGSSSPELSLDLKPTTYTPKTITVFLKEISMIGNVSERLCKLNDYIMRLEEEMKKIDAFKRELPLCMLLLNDSILKLKEETVHCSKSSSDDDVVVQPVAVMEEFIPIMRNSDDETSGVKKEKDSRDKMNWMSSAQLWSSNDFSKISDQKQKSVERAEEDDLSVTTENTFPVCKYKNGGVGFLPFNGLSGFPVAMTKTRKEETEVQQTPSLSLSTLGGLKTTNSEQNSGILISKSSGGCRNHPSVSTSNVQSNLQTGTQSQQLPRKQRRCWSPDLHRRFVSALQQLGGSQVATPKQIRELMKVEGLTNDEVKSHLQKYRLHTRRVPNGSSTTTANQQPVVVLGGLWMSSQDQYGTSKSSTSQSESPQGPLQLAGGGGGISTTGGDSMEDDEDGRSESYSWKGHLNKTGETDPID